MRRPLRAYRGTVGPTLSGLAGITLVVTLALGTGTAGLNRMASTMLLVFAASMGFLGVLLFVLVGAASAREFLQSRDRRSERRRHESAHKV